MSYILVNDLTYSYVATLIARNGYTDVTSSNPDFGSLYVIQDLDGNLSGYPDLDLLRREMILQYVIQQNG